MERFNARSIIIIIAAFALVAGSLFLLRKLGGGPGSSLTGPVAMASAASGPGEVAGQTPPMELLGSVPSGGDTPGSSAASVPVSISASVPPSVPASTMAAAPATGSQSAAQPPAHAASQPASAPASAPASISSSVPAHPAASAARAASAPIAAPSKSTTTVTTTPSAKSAPHATPVSAPATKAAPAPAKASGAAPKVASVAAPKSAPAHAAPVSAKAPIAPATSGKGIYFQCGAFKDPANAGKLLAQLKAAGVPAKIVEANGLRHVVAGPFTGSADSARARLQAAGVDKPFVTKG